MHDSASDSPNFLLRILETLGELKTFTNFNKTPFFVKQASAQTTRFKQFRPHPLHKPCAQCHFAAIPVPRQLMAMFTLWKSTQSHKSSARAPPDTQICINAIRKNIRVGA